MNNTIQTKLHSVRDAMKSIGDAFTNAATSVAMFASTVHSLNVGSVPAKYPNASVMKQWFRIARNSDSKKYLFRCGEKDMFYWVRVDAYCMGEYAITICGDFSKEESTYPVAWLLMADRTTYGACIRKNIPAGKTRNNRYLTETWNSMFTAWKFYLASK